MTITPPPIHSYETPPYSELANDFRSWVDWLWRTWYVAAADPDLEWESIPGVVVELDVLWRSWAHAWSGAGSLYERREWLDYLPRAVDHMARLVAGWNESAGMESSRAAYSLATSGAGSLGLVPGALRWANTKPSRAAGALLRWRGRSRCLARRCIGLWRLFTIEGVGGV